MDVNQMIINYWDDEGERIKEWIEDKVLSQLQGNRADWDDFYTTAQFVEFEDPEFSFVTNEIMGFMGCDVIKAFEKGIQVRFNMLVDEVMDEQEDQIAEHREHERDYFRDVI